MIETTKKNETMKNETMKNETNKNIMKTRQVHVGMHVSGKSTGCSITAFPANKDIYGTVVSVRDGMEQILVDVNMHGTIIPCKIETITIHGQ